MTSRSRRIKRIMSAAEAGAVPAVLLKQLRDQGIYPPIGGGSTGAPPTDDNPAGGGGGAPPADADADDSDDDDADADEDDDDEDTKPAPKGKRASKPKPSDSDDDGYVRMPRSEVSRLRREAREARAETRKREAEERARREKDLADQEKWKDLAESLQERTTELEGEIEALKMERTKDERKSNIVKVAKRLQFEYPEDAHRFLDADDMEDEHTIERALTAVLQERPKLKSRRRGSGAPIPGDADDPGKSNGLTLEDVKKMTPAEINRRWPEVQAAMRASGELLK